jgi:hypothetical protein
MKRTASAIKLSILLMIFLSLSLSATTLAQFTGNWKNVKHNTRAITKLKLYQQRNGLKIQVFGSCSPKECDWGRQKAFAYGNSVSTNTARKTKVIMATYRKDFSITQLVLKMRRNRLIVESFTRFIDHSGRANYSSINTFIKERRVKLKSPKIISPRNNALFHHFPRKTLLRWKRVKGAVEYGVEIDCLNCCKSGKWCLDVNREVWQKTKTKNTSFRFNYVGAQWGRWRVWAIDKNGKRGPKTKWRKFRYTQ